MSNLEPRGSDPHCAACGCRPTDTSVKWAGSLRWCESEKAHYCRGCRPYNDATPEEVAEDMAGEKAAKEVEDRLQRAGRPAGGWGEQEARLHARLAAAYLPPILAETLRRYALAGDGDGPWWWWS
jgi:hypothetical protein